MEPLTEQLQISIRLQQLKRENEGITERQDRDQKRINANLIKMQELRKRAEELDRIIEEANKKENE